MVADGRRRRRFGDSSRLSAASDPKRARELGEGRDVAATGPIEQQRPYSNRGRPADILLAAISDMERLASITARHLEPGAEYLGVRLAGADAGRGDDPVEEVADSDSIEDRSQRVVPVRDADQAEPAPAQPFERRRHVVERTETNARHQRLDRHLATQLARQHRRTSAPKVGE